MSEINSLIFYIVSFIISSMIITKVGNIYKSEDSNKNVNKIKIIIYTIIGLGIPILIASLRLIFLLSTMPRQNSTLVNNTSTKNNIINLNFICCNAINIIHNYKTHIKKYCEKC